jgi:TPR repeat protein
MQLNKRDILDQVREAIDLIEKDRYAEALVLLRPLAVGGSTEAKFQIGKLGLRKEGVDRSEALSMFKEAAALDHPDACFHLAFLADSESGAGIYTQEGKALLEKAGQLGSIDAQRILGTNYATGNWGGTITENNGERARFWYQKAADNGDPDSQYDLALMFVNGEGGPVDIPAGHSLLKSLEQHWLAKRILADICGGAPEPIHLLHLEPAPGSAE